jgi:uncharacterized protein YsxB (DUF464 family)
MIKIEVKQRQGEMEIYTEGHAQFAKEGEPDILCAAVSAIMQTAAVGLERLAEQYPTNITFKLVEIK